MGHSGPERHAQLLESVFNPSDATNATYENYKFVNANPNASDGKYALFTVSNEPTVEDALAAVEVAKREGCDCVLAIGGGSGE
jgi:alcohol dehydrogenase class IV